MVAQIASQMANDGRGHIYDVFDDGTIKLRPVQEQLGVDPVSKLAAAIERLCDILDDGSQV